MTVQKMTKIKLLIVDDEGEFRDALGERLEIREFDVRTVGSGVEALALCAREDVDLALVDLKMPGMDGRQLLEKLKAENKYLGVIILTGHGSMVSAVECTKLGAFNYLPKPYKMDELLAVLKGAFIRSLSRKFADDSARTKELLQIAQQESPLAVLRRMKELDQAHD